MEKQSTTYKISNLSQDCKEYTITEIVDWLYSEAIKNTIPKGFQRVNSKQLDNEIMKRAWDIVSLWNYQQPKVLSLISVMNGIGKTHIAVLLLKKYLYTNIQSLVLSFIENEYIQLQFIDCSYIQKQIHKCKFINEITLSAEIKECLNYKSNTSENDILRELGRYKLLVIDDIFSSNQKDLELSRRILLDLLERRINQYELPTILTSNMNLIRIKDVDPRIADRINNSMLIEISTKIDSYRRRL